MKNIGKELAMCVGYFIVMYILISVLIPAQYRGPLLRISAYVIIAAFVVNIFKLVFGASNTGFFSSFFRWAAILILCAYALSFLGYLTIDGFRDLINKFIGG